jgi:tetratricopeptide (TPR) repeat protein
MGGGNSSIRFYERALAVRPDYFPTHHYLAHAYENVGQMERALEHASMYAGVAPAVPHAHHMRGHVLRRVDRMNDAIAEFRRADELEVAYFKAENIPPEYDWHYHHNLDLLGTAYEYVGQMRSAEPILRRSFELRSIELSQELNEKSWPMFLLARGRAAEALTASHALVGRQVPLVQALGHLLASRALMALHRMDDATPEGDAGLRQMRASGAVGGVLVPELQLTQGELLLRTGQAERGRAMLRDAVVKVQAGAGPDAWIQTLFSLEGAFGIARDAGDWELAADVAEHMRQHDSSYAGTHYALGLAAERRGDFAVARGAYGEAVLRWSGADAALPDLADARHRLAGLDAPNLSGPVNPR